MKYKALIFDLDGTAIETKKDALPTEELINLIKKIKSKFIVSIATGRPFNLCQHLVELLAINQPCIVAGGTQIINPVTNEIIWTKIINRDDVEKIINLCKQFPYETIFGNEVVGTTATNKTIIDTNVIYIMNVDSQDYQYLLNQLNSLENVIAHEAGSYVLGKFDIHITHKQAGKMNALKKWLTIKNLKKEEVIAVGDRGNDIPLFNNAGLKVAMGNATDDLKHQADYIAPSVTDNGLVDVINKFIIPNI